MLYLVIVNGLIDSFNPCAIGVLISYLALILSFKTARKQFLNFGLVYILATYATYFLIGLVILRVIHLFGIHNFFGWVSTVVILALGTFNIKEFFWPQLRIPFLSSFLGRCRLPRWKPEFTILGALILGFLIGLCEFPCSGGVYLATVSLLSIKETFLKGVGYLLVYNLMFILPLMIIFIFAGNRFIFQKLQDMHGKMFSWTKLIMGISMVASGALLLAWLIISIK